MQNISHWLASKPRFSDKICIKNLRTIANAGYDAWGRAKVQPVVISVTLYLTKAFTSAASSDEIDGSTVHYGQLSKALLAKTRESADGDEGDWKTPLDFNDSLLTAVSDVAKLEGSDTVAAVELQVLYPKAAHMAAGIAYTTRWLRGTDRPLQYDSVTLLRSQVASLVGVHSYERGAPQMIIVTVQIDMCRGIAEHTFELEQIILRTSGESAYLTLEALGEELAVRLIKYFVVPNNATLQPRIPGPVIHEGTDVTVSIEKPSAVPMADAPMVEVCRSADASTEFGRRMYDELGVKRNTIPFPLQGRLDDLINSWKQD